LGVVLHCGGSLEKGIFGFRGNYRSA
jgi:hypothetical protein